jgi:GTP-binding protein EngB required for normal cell division
MDVKEFLKESLNIQLSRVINKTDKLKEQYMNKKLLISQSIMWAAAILVVSIVDEKQFAISMLVILATVSLMNLRKGK